MQTSAPELIDMSKEDMRTLDAYRGPRRGAASFREQLPARAPARGARRFGSFNSITTDWDHHGDAVNNLGKGLDAVCQQG